jgi:hypothetical protein
VVKAAETRGAMLRAPANQATTRTRGCFTQRSAIVYNLQITNRARSTLRETRCVRGP